ncbi:PD-(D/E)XK nuclease family protein [Dokdonia sp. Hel_I_53]|uniref:PD-(D/E)XK nuclease family protein n=1 Tax=Dokdonia sp. Hel_I_53 TaxID=1566287 RepID=UPI00119B0E0F|nr:PD-(D/E)XK nuclease family protein [Dokdonia sp. Hel_I_53]TVZ52617.1 PD-(D/E)XK nuclease superfamily protein [Dokdonia sp. Hel_I_53]
MQTFIDTVLNEEQNFSDFNTIFISPSRRAGGLLRKKLAQRNTKTRFAPQIFSIEEFIEHISGLSASSTIDLTFKLYESYKEVVLEPVSFQIFSTWAQPILSDFNEIDRYLLDHNQIFNHLKDLKNINDHWSHSSNALVVNYLDFWNSLLKIYEVFIEKCLQQKATHQGYVYRQAVQNIEHYMTSVKDTRHVFLGFNALNTSEQQIIQSLLSREINTIYWDSEETFMNNKSHEAGIFIRNFKNTWPYYTQHAFKWTSNNYKNQKKIQTFSVSQNIHQAKTVGALLSKLSKEDIYKTAIILGDESLLLPILNSLPLSVDKVNVTMGVPLGKTPAASFFDQLIEMKKSATDRGYYYKNVLSLIEHPLSKKLLGDTLKPLENKIIKENKIFIQPDELIKNYDKDTLDILESLFAYWENDPKRAVKNILDIIQALKANYLKSQSLQLEYLFGFYKAFNKLEEIIASSSYVEDISTLIYFYREVLSSETIDLTGDPEEGLQIMGVLESRVMDYERIIITSVNEGILPSGKSQNSYIPYDLKRFYNLPTYTEKDAIYAYHFYHTLHRSKYISLIYTTESKGIGSSEPSRFIKQLEREKIHTISHQIVAPPTQKIAQKKLTISKTPEIIEKINDLLRKGISPSALSTYLRNPLIFYERYILGVDESDNVEETVAANTMGTIVHNTLEEIYKPLVGSHLAIADLMGLLNTFPDEVQNQFKKEYGDTHIKEGKNLIIYEIVCRFIENYLKLEIKNLQKGDNVYIQSVEENLYDIPLTDTINLRGKVDLVEERNGNFNIIDYKTGKVTQNQLRITDWQDLLLPEGKAEKAFQVLMYAYMIHKKESLSFPVSVGIISFKNLQSGYLPFKFDKDPQVTDVTLKHFETILKQLVNEILDPEVPFQDRT